MSHNQAVADHYTNGSLLDSIEKSIAASGISRDQLTIDDLAPVDEFHIGGRAATQRLVNQLGFSADDHVLDVGCGIGGPARFVASHFKSRVTGIDLTPEFIEVGNALSSWVGLDARVSLQLGSALELPFADESFDGAYVLHVGMNISDKAGLFSEIFRVLRPGASLGVYDIMRSTDGDLAYPVPWASVAETSHMATLAEYADALTQAGFGFVRDQNYREFALEFFERIRSQAESAKGDAPLGLNTLMKESMSAKLKNLVQNVASGLIAPMEVIVQKPEA